MRIEGNRLRGGVGHKQARYFEAQAPFFLGRGLIDDDHVRQPGLEPFDCFLHFLTELVPDRGSLRVLSRKIGQPIGKERILQLFILGVRQ